MAEAYGPTSCSSGYVLKSELLHYPESQYGFILKLCHQSAKTIALAGLKTMVSLSHDDYASLFFSEAMFLLLC